MKPYIPPAGVLTAICGGLVSAGWSAAELRAMLREIAADPIWDEAERRRQQMHDLAEQITDASGPTDPTRGTQGDQ